ncbi:winged helix-turn-helix domain-containing protein, partial [Corynebacterium durum]|uniref:winged helix-turn-helix domain-containing protein n=1 Tax=Corynebacterium durum TaxID=61592 RepID=UPI0028800D90
MANKSSRSTIAAPALVELLGPLPDRVTSAWVSSHIMALVAEGRLRTGSILPSERSLAITLDVSRGTVTRAMEELIEHDMLDSKRGSGLRVRLPIRAARPVQLLDPPLTLASSNAADLRLTVLPPPTLV